MIRYLYIIGLMLGCMGFSLQAKGIVPTVDTPSTNAKTQKTETKSTASSTDKDKAKTTAAKPPTPTDAPSNSSKLLKADTKTAASSSDKDKAKSTTAKTSTPAASVAKTSTNTQADSHAKTAPAVAKVADNKPSSSSHPASQALSGAPSVASARSSSSSPASTTHSSHTSTSAGGRLARVTAYWAGEGDYYTGKCLSSTGIHLHDGHCAVDPRIIPYGSTVDIAGVGKYLAVDTGSAVISREAAKEAAHNQAERDALVIDVFFESRRDGQHFANSGPKYAAVTWTSPRSTASTQDVRSTAAE